MTVDDRRAAQAEIIEADDRDCKMVGDPEQRHDRRPSTGIR